MAIAHVQTSTEVVVSAANSGSVTLTGVGAGNLLVAVLTQNDSASRTYAFSDDKSNAWAVAIHHNPSVAAHISFGKNTASGNTLITATIAGGLTSTFRFKVLEFSGADTAAPLDVVSELAESVNSNNHTSSADATVIDTVADPLVVCAAILNAPGTATAAGAGYTQVTNGAASTTLWQYKIASGALANEQGAWSNTGTARMGRSAIASFKPAAGGGGTTYTSTLTAAMASAGALSRRTSTAKAGSIASAGALNRQTARALAGALTPAGALAAVKTALVSLAGTLTSGGALVKQTGKVAAGSLASAGALVRQTSRALTGALTSAGATAAVKTALVSLAGTLTSAGTLTRQAGKLTAGTLTSSAALVRQTAQVLTGTLTSAGALAKRTARGLTGTLTSAGALTSQNIGGLLAGTAHVIVRVVAFARTITVPAWSRTVRVPPPTNEVEP